MTGRFERVVELIPAALEVVLHNSEAVVDDTCLSRLLSWLEQACNSQKEKCERLQSALSDFVIKVCAEAKHSIAIAFGLKVSTVSNAVIAFCWKEVLRFISEGQMDLLRHEDAAVRCSAYECLRRLTHVPEAVLLVCETDLVVRCLSGLHDNSMFVSQAASSFLCSWLHFSGGLQCVADCTLRVSTLQTKVFHIIDHFRSFFKSSSLQHDIIRSVFILAKEFMEMSTQTSGLFIVSIDLLRLTDVAIKNGDRNVCVSVVEFLSKLVRVGRELELCWSDLLDSTSDSVTVRDHDAVLLDWLIKQPIVLLQRGFARLAVTCLCNYLTSNGLFSSSHWHEVITVMMMSPLFLVVGPVTSYHNLKTATQEDAFSQFKSKLEDTMKEKYLCLLVVSTCLGFSDVIMSQHCNRDLPFCEWCNSVCTALTLSVGMSVLGESCITAYGSHLIRSHKVTLAALRSLQHLMNTEVCRDQCCSIIEVLVDVLQTTSLLPKVVSMVLKQLLNGLIRFKEHSKQWSTKVCLILTKLLVSPHWEDRDSALEFISSILEAWEAPILFCDCDNITLDVWRCVNDSESFVRASAFRAIGHLTVYDELLSPLLLALKFTPADIIQTVCHIAESDTEAFARRSAVQLLSTWLENAKFANFLLSTCDHMEEEISQVVQNVLHVVIKDFDCDVKLQALGFWEKLLNNGKFSSQAAAVKFLITAGGADDLVTAAEDHEKAVRQKSFAILKLFRDRMSGDEETTDGIVKNFMDRLSTFTLNHEKHQNDHDDDDDAYSMLEDILACADETISSDCKLLDCY
ncbi:uncharacterized protein LOC134184932 isoform X2 [Corticium candelabrum]|uniref:uncharacterized protein LOC134184932 isoform X2 n=1 Tax=Corticium candelabrum TaxID=121492 RepID=UPI002E3693EE|nr:uncharacterized protein LOC134184932 isoform X2 [Corticium candelabrum]